MARAICENLENKIRFLDIYLYIMHKNKIKYEIILYTCSIFCNYFILRYRSNVLV